MGGFGLPVPQLHLARLVARRLSGPVIMITVLSINFLVDALRDLLAVRETRDLAHA